MKKLTFIITLFIVSTLNANAQKKDTTAKQQTIQPAITDSLPLITIQQIKNYLQSIDKRQISVYEFNILSGAFQAVIDEAVKAFMKPNVKK